MCEWTGEWADEYELNKIGLETERVASTYWTSSVPARATPVPTSYVNHSPWMDECVSGLMNGLMNVGGRR